MPVTPSDKYWAIIAMNGKPIPKKYSTKSLAVSDMEQLVKKTRTSHHLLEVVGLMEFPPLDIALQDVV